MRRRSARRGRSERSEFASERENAIVSELCGATLLDKRDLTDIVSDSENTITRHINNPFGSFRRGADMQTVFEMNSHRNRMREVISRYFDDRAKSRLAGVDNNNDI